MKVLVGALGINWCSHLLKNLLVSQGKKSRFCLQLIQCTSILNLSGEIIFSFLIHYFVKSNFFSFNCRQNLFATCSAPKQSLTQKADQVNDVKLCVVEVLCPWKCLIVTKEKIQMNCFVYHWGVQIFHSQCHPNEFITIRYFGKSDSLNKMFEYSIWSIGNCKRHDKDKVWFRLLQSNFHWNWKHAIMQHCPEPCRPLEWTTADTSKTIWFFV